MDSDDFIYNSEIFPDTHYFVYENKRYPIKYDYFKRSSNYFQKNKEQIKNNPNIQLLDDNFDKNIQLKLVFDMKSEMMKEINKLKDELKDQKKVNENQMKAVEKEHVGVFAYQKGNEFHGIIDHLTTQTGGNIHDNKTIEITTNQYYTNNEPRYVVDYNTDNGFFSKDEDGCFLCFDFKDKLIQISDYSIKSYDQKINHCHPKNWVIEVSKNGEKWDEIDRHENDPTLNRCRIIATFNIKKKIDYFYRFIRIRQTGNSWDERGNHYFFGIDFIEFYGKIKLNLMLYHKE